MPSVDPPAPAGDAAALADHAAALAGAVDLALPAWVRREITRVAEAWRPGLASELERPIAQAIDAVQRDVGPRLRSLLDADVDAQPTSPLALLRTAVRHLTAVLHRAGVPPVVRDEFAERAFPDDDYDLTPASFADVDPSLAEPGLVWGAAKAHVVLGRRREEGLR